MKKNEESKIMKICETLKTKTKKNVLMIEHIIVSGFLTQFLQSQIIFRKLYEIIVTFIKLNIF
jgi:hypothetical protein